MFDLEPKARPSGKMLSQYRQLAVDVLESLVIAAIVCAFVYAFIATPNIVHGPSMYPTFKENQLVLTTSRIAHWFSETVFGKAIGLDYMRGEVVVFHNSTSNEDLIKRVIALPGDRVMVKTGHVYINEERLIETYLPNDLETLGGSFLTEGQEITIPERHFFVMGDNRLDSRDSRDSRIGLVSRDDILGKVLVRYWPLNEFTVIRPGEVKSAA